MYECDEVFRRLWLQKIMIQPENITYGKSSTVQNELFQMTDLRKPANKKENARRKKIPLTFNIWPRHWHILYFLVNSNPRNWVDENQKKKKK